MSKYRNKIPDRWTDYTDIGKQVQYTRFLPFKVPLKENICRKAEEHFTPEILLEKQPKLKLIIDLTNTSDGRYYYADSFNKSGVDTVKIKCPGGAQQIPSISLVNKFCSIVDKFVTYSTDNSSDSLIGVHCTHGLNRTGYFICKYMITKLGIKPQNAIEYFEVARGYPMERPLMIKDILRTYSRKAFQAQSPLSTCYDDEISSTSRYSRR